MIEIVGIRFKKGGKVYYFSPIENTKAHIGEKVIVETSRGTECGTIVIENRMIDEKSISSPLKPILRIANADDLNIINQNRQREKEQFDLLQRKWGSEIVREDTSNKGKTKKVKKFDYNPIVKVPIKGI